MDKGIRLQKEIAMGLKGANKEASGTLKKNAKVPAKGLQCCVKVKKGNK